MENNDKIESNIEVNTDIDNSILLPENNIGNVIEGGEKIENMGIEDLLNQSYGTYGAYTNYNRAIPDLTDGVKPVIRRIIWAISQPGVIKDNKSVKSAKLEGDVMGKYHPHGGCYPTFAGMAQDFNFRYPLIEGQGNFGSIDNFKGLAAPRYTEVKPAKITKLLTDGIEKLGKQYFRDNYDQTLKEPYLLPAKIPFLFLNGTVGIGLGTSSKTFSFNLGEVVDTLIERTKDSNFDISKTLKGPDFPLGGKVVINNEHWKNIINTGNGSVTYISDVEIAEDKKSGKKILVVKNIPPHTNSTAFLESIKKLVISGKIPEIMDVRDETNNNLVLDIKLILKSGSNAQVVLSKLYKYSYLQTSLNARYIVLNKGRKPEKRSINKIFDLFIEWRKEIIKEMISFDLEKLRKQELMISTKLKAIENIDQIIDILKKSNNDTETISELEKNIGLTKEQAEIIIELKLRNLMKSNADLLNSNLEETKKQIIEKKEIIDNTNILVDYMINEWIDIKKEFSDDRRTTIINSGSKEAMLSEIDESDLQNDNMIKIYLTTNGYIRKDDEMKLKIQKRGGKGRKGDIKVKDEEFIKKTIITNNRRTIGIITDQGRIFYVKGYHIPINKKGMPLNSILGKDINEIIVNIFVLEDIQNDKILVLYKNGRGLITNGKNLDCRNGKKLFKGIVNYIDTIKDKDYLITGKNSGYTNRIDIKDIRDINKIGKGVNIVKIKEIEKKYKDIKTKENKSIMIKEEVVSAELVRNDNLIITISKEGLGKVVEVEGIKKTNRGTKGTMLGIKREDELLFIGKVEKEELEKTILNIVTKNNLNIFVKADELKMSKKNHKGIKIISLNDNDYIINVSMLNEDDIIEAEENTDTE